MSEENNTSNKDDQSDNSNNTDSTSQEKLNSKNDSPFKNPAEVSIRKQVPISSKTKKNFDN